MGLLESLEASRSRSLSRAPEALLEFLRAPGFVERGPRLSQAVLDRVDSTKHE